jgi:type II secretory pathway pseudopilin PulG
LELLVVLGVVAVLTALTLPALFHARKGARDTRSAANCKQLGSLISMYADRSSGLFPIPRPGQGVPAATDALLISYPYWDFHRTWQGVLYQDLPYASNIGVYRSPHAKYEFEGDIPWPSSYSLTLTAGAPGELWTPGFNQAAVLPRVMRIDDSLFPSSKGMLWEVGTHKRSINEDGAEQTPIAFIDTSVRMLVPAKASDPITNTINTSGYANARIHNTRLGLQGVDY